jgi:hypothetical protein
MEAPEVEKPSRDEATRFIPAMSHTSTSLYTTGKNIYWNTAIIYT